MSWQLLLTGYLFLGTASYLIRRNLAKTISQHNRLVNGFFFIAILYPTGLVVAAFTSPNLNIGWFSLALLLGGSVIWPVINLLSFRASKDVDAGLYTVLNNITPIVTIAAAWLLLQEKLNEQQLLGAAIILLSAFLVTLPHLRRSVVTRGITIALASVTLLGMAVVYERYMLTRMDFGAYLVYGWGAQTFWMAVLAWPERRHLHLLRSKYGPQIISYGVTNTFKGLCFVAALKLSGNASLVSAFTSFMAVLVVLAAFIFLKEREQLGLKIGSAVIGTIGLIILNTS